MFFYIYIGGGLIALHIYIIGFDPHLDNPVEPLHTVLLGVIKYAWSITTAYVIDSNNLHVLEIRLRDANVDGLSIEALRAAYLTQYKGGLIGRQLKSIVQVIVFATHGIVSDNIRKMWIAAGNMVSLLWYTEYEDKDKYLVYKSSFTTLFTI